MEYAIMIIAMCVLFNKVFGKATSGELKGSELAALAIERNAAALPMYTMKPTGNLEYDFALFTKLQGGGKSDNKSDAAFLNNTPPTPDKDGRYYHTVDDIIYSTFKKANPDATNLPYDFYNMTTARRAKVVKSFLVKTTTSDACNALLSYCNWGGGGFKRCAEIFKENYGIDLFAAIKKNEADAFNKICLCRIAQLKASNNFIVQGQAKTNWEINGLGWTRGVLCLWNVFRQYIK